jgi:pimeloyl-ACP methyl ester carboxylesterase
MVSWRMLGIEASALGAAALSLPLRLVLPRRRFDPAAAHPTPLVLVHGFLGDPSNFLLLQAYLALAGVRNFATFAYWPRLDYQRLARHLGRAIDAVRAATGAHEVDVVGHSLGGLVARYLVESEARAPVRRLVTLGSPYFATPPPPGELSVFGASDPFIPPPHPRHGPYARQRPQGARPLVVRDCGHWGLLYHPTVLRETAAFLLAPPGSVGLEEPHLRLDAAS